MNGEIFVQDREKDSYHPLVYITLNSSKLKNKTASFYLSIPGPLSPALAPRTFMLLCLTVGDKWIKIYTDLSEYESPSKDAYKA